MDRRQFKSKNSLLRLGLTSTGKSDEPSGSQLSTGARTSTLSSFRPIIPASKRKKSPSPECDNDTKRKRYDATQENPRTQEQILRNKPSSVLSDYGSQSSNKSRSSVMSIFASMSKRNANFEKPSTSFANVPNVANIKSQEKLVSTQVTPVKKTSQRPSVQSVSPNTSEFERRLFQSDTEVSPVRPVEKEKEKENDDSAKKRLLRELTTPSKSGGSDSDQNIFSSGSSSATKKGRLSLGTPKDKNDDNETTPVRKNVSRRILENDDISPIRGNIFSSTRNEEADKISSLFSPDRPVRNEPEFATPRPVRTRSKFVSFLNAARVTLMEGDAPHQINGDPNDIKINMKKLLQKGYNKDEIVEDWKNYIEVENNLMKATQTLKVIHDGQPFPSWYNTSLIKLLLQLVEIQKPLLEILLQKLNEVLLEADDAESVPWAFTLVQQLRFLEFIVDPESLTESIINLIEGTPIWFQKELIVFLPDIVIDSQHHAISEVLLKLLDERPELMGIILDTLSTLSFGKFEFEELRDKLITMLETTDPCNVPVIASFVLHNCNEEKPAEKILQMLRKVHLEPLPNTNLEECYTNQMSTVKAINQAMKAFKKVVNATANILKTSTEKAIPMDLIYLLIFFQAGVTAQKSAPTILKQKIRLGNYRLRLLNTFYNDYIQVARELQASALELASILVKSDDRVYAELGIDWFVLIFTSQSEIYKQRQVLDKILQLVGFNNLTAKRAFTILSKMIVDEEKRKYLYSHCNTLRILLEKVNNLDLESAAILSDVLHGLCIQSSSISESLYDDLSILMSKQLASSKPLTKCKGVLSACMAIKHFAIKEEKFRDAKNLFEKVVLGVKLCSRSRALFYDRMSMVVFETENMDANFLTYMKDYFENKLEEYLVGDEPISDDMDKAYGLNSSHDAPSELIINFGEGKFGGILPILFRLIRMCHSKLSGECENLQDINALLGCSILVPKHLDDPEPKNLDYMLYCINWFREVISGFVKDTDSRLQRQVLKRLDDLMKIQGEFQILLSMCDTRYEPPQAYFHHFPDKPFIKIEKKSSKKGKKPATDKTCTLGNAEWETFDLGSLLVSKNPTYFRKLDIKVVHLLNIKMDMTLTQTSSQATSIAQVCFVIKELLGMLENDDSELLIRDLINLLPEICSKFQDIADEVKENEIDDCQMREALVLLLQLINKIFSWKELQNSAKHIDLLKAGLSTIAQETRGMNVTQIATKDLVAEAYKFFEKIREIAEGRSIVLAYNIVNVCETLMKHSKLFENEIKEKHAAMAYNFLSSKDWLDKQTGALYRNAIAGLLKTWIDNEPSPLKKVAEVVDWLGEDVENLIRPADCLKNLPSINKSNFPLLFKKILEGLIKGAKIDLRGENLPDTAKLATWEIVGRTVANIVEISRAIRIKTVHILSVRYLIIIIRLLINQGLLILEHNLSYQPQDVMRIINYFQKSTRYLHSVYCTGVSKKDTTMAKYFPTIKSIYDEFLCRMKGMMAFNDSLDYFKLGNLIKKDLDGQKIQSQSSTEDASSVIGDLDGMTEGTESNLSEILGDEDLPDVAMDVSHDEINEEEEEEEEENDGDVDDDTNTDSN